MAADQTLIKGAYAAAAGPESIPMSKENREKIEKSTQAFGTALGAYVQKKEKEKSLEEQEAEKQRLIEEQEAERQRLIDEEIQKAEQKERLIKADNIVNEILESGSKFDEDNYTRIHEDLSANVDAFITASPEQQAIMLNSLQEESNQIDKLQDIQLEFAKLYKTKLTDDFKNGMVVNGFLEPTVTKNEDGEWGCMIYNPKLQKDRKTQLSLLNNELESLRSQEGYDTKVEEKMLKDMQLLQDEIDASDLNPQLDVTFHNGGQLKSIIEENSIDTDTQEMFNQMGNNARSMGGSIPTGQTQEFNYRVGLQQAIKIVKSADTNKRSLIYDDMIGDTKSFYQNFQEAIRTNTYGDFGILSDFNVDPNAIESLDPNTDNDPNTISAADAKIIVDKLVSDEAMVDKYLSHYFANFMKNNWNEGLNNRVTSTTETTTYNPEEEL